LPEIEALERARPKGSRNGKINPVVTGGGSGIGRACAGKARGDGLSRVCCGLDQEADWPANEFVPTDRKSR
jgi:hypothetical protein